MKLYILKLVRKIYSYILNNPIVFTSLIIFSIFVFIIFYALRKYILVSAKIKIENQKLIEAKRRNDTISAQKEHLGKEKRDKKVAVTKKKKKERLESEKRIKRKENLETSAKKENLRLEREKKKKDLEASAKKENLRLEREKIKKDLEASVKKENLRLERERKKKDLEASTKKEELKLEREKKINWQFFEAVLQNNNINKLYHFTDRANIESIKKNGGLYSWSYCQKNNISIANPGGSSTSRFLDQKKGLENYVRISFVSDHPMLFVAQTEGRIKNPVLLEISIDLIYKKETKYAIQNAAKNGVVADSSYNTFKSIKFNVLRRRYFDLSDNERPYYQAEILILEKIPLEFITNINNI